MRGFCTYLPSYMNMNDNHISLARINKILLSQIVAAKYLTEGLASYGDDFLLPLLNAIRIFNKVEVERVLTRTPQQNFTAYYDLLNFNVALFTRYAQGCVNVLENYNKKESARFHDALLATLNGNTDKTLDEYFLKNEEVLHRVVVEYPQAILDIENEYGFHFERDPESLIAETDRYYLYQTKPNRDHVEVDNSLKPVLIIPPFVLGGNILGFLPGEHKSYAHAFANRSIPTYIRLMKDIHETPAVQTMTLEDNARDTRYFCEKIKQRHGLPVTLNGYCQGGYSSLCNILSGELDGLVDAFITCVAPMDGTRSKGLGTFLKSLPKEFNDLAYGTKVLDNGNRIADGELMGWIYKLKSIETSGPLIALLNDMMMLDGGNSKRGGIKNKTVAAINYWLANERSDLPMAVTEMSYLSYNVPIDDDGTLPVRLFGKSLNLKALKEKNITWLLCYGEDDDLVEKEVALAPCDYIDIEVTPFPKGHVAIATSWSDPNSSCALDSVFGKENYRGPVRFQLDLSKNGQKQ